MRKAALAGAFALATIGSPLAMADGMEHGTGPVQVAQGSGFVLTSGHIAHLKSALKLSPDQERYWPRVEAALRTLARQQSHGQAASPGIVQRIRQKAAAITLDAMAMKRLVAAAAPLIRTLDQEQKRDALMLARAAGMGALAAAF
jgi:hypothetical protein